MLLHDAIQKIGINLSLSITFRRGSFLDGHLDTFDESSLVAYIDLVITDTPPGLHLSSPSLVWPSAK